PRARESGKWRGHRFTGQGRRHVRRSLCLAALSAMRTGSPFAPFVRRLREQSEAGRTTAIARFPEVAVDRPVGRRHRRGEQGRQA
ncbi:MAG: hypothetical protein D6832_02235, partial [Alphaproteobacteria bacterium]